MDGLHPARLARLDTTTECLSEDEVTLSDSYQLKTGANSQPLGPRGSGPADALGQLRLQHYFNDTHEQSTPWIAAQEDMHRTREAFAESLDELIAGVRNEIDPGNKLSNVPHQHTGEKGVESSPLMKQELPIPRQSVSYSGSPPRYSIITSVAPSTVYHDDVNKRKCESSQGRTTAIDNYSLPPGGLRRKYDEGPRPKTARTEVRRPGNMDLSRPLSRLGGPEHENVPSRTRRLDPDSRIFKLPSREFSRRRDDLTRLSYVPREDRTRRRTPDAVEYRRPPPLSHPPRAHGIESARTGSFRSRKSPSRSEILMPRLTPLNTPFRGSIYLHTKPEDVEKNMLRPWEPEKTIMWVGGGYTPGRGSVVTVVQKSQSHLWTAHVFCLSKYQAPTSNDAELWAIIKALEMAYETSETRTRRFVLYSHCQNGLMMLERNEHTRETRLIETVASRSQLLYDQGKKLELHWISKKHDTGCTESVAAANNAVTGLLPFSVRREHENESRPIIFTGTTPADLVEATLKWQRGG
jgi:ribonuclease HI